MKKYWQESEKEKLLKIKKKIEKENTKKRLLNMMNFKYAKDFFVGFLVVRHVDDNKMFL